MKKSQKGRTIQLDQTFRIGFNEYLALRHRVVKVCRICQGTHQHAKHRREKFGIDTEIDNQIMEMLLRGKVKIV